MPRRAQPRNDPEHPARRLLVAASAAFSRRGFDQTSLADVAAEAHLARTGVYYYFPNKLALLVTIVEEVQVRFHARLDAIEQANLAPPVALAEIVREHVGLICRELAAMRVLVHELRRVPPDTPALQPIVARRRRYRERLAAVIRQGIESGQFAPIEPALAVEAVLGLANSVLDWVPPPDQLDAATVSEVCAQLVLRSLQASTRTESVGG